MDSPLTVHMNWNHRKMSRRTSALLLREFGGSYVEVPILCRYGGERLAHLSQCLHVRRPASDWSCCVDARLRLRKDCSSWRSKHNLSTVIWMESNSIPRKVRGQQLSLSECFLRSWIKTVSNWAEFVFRIWYYQKKSSSWTIKGSMMHDPPDCLD